MPVEEIDKMDSWEGAQLNTAKEILAYELTKLVHGEEEAQKAQASAKALFGGGEDGEIPSTVLGEDDFVDGTIDIMSLLVLAELVPSKSEARRALQQGGVTVDGEKVTDIRAVYDKETLKNGILIKRGKKAYKKVVLN